MVFKSSGIQKLYIKGIFGLVIYLGIVLALTFGAFTKKDEPVETVNTPKDTYSWIMDKKLTEEDLEGKDNYELRLMRNYYFARHGVVFKDKELTDYFSQFEWYEPISDDVNAKITKQERENIKLIRSFERKAK